MNNLLGYVWYVLLNVFFWDRDPRQCAACHGDKHIHKMIVEYAQIASTALRVLNNVHLSLPPDLVYRPCQATSNVVKWTAGSFAHFTYVVQLGLALVQEREDRRPSHPTWRSEGRHKSEPCLLWLRDHVTPDLFPETSWTSDPPLRMPEVCQVDTLGQPLSCQEAFRLYAAYKVHTINLKFDKNREPVWLQGKLVDIQQRLDILKAIKVELEEKRQKREKKKNKKLKMI